MWTLKTSVSKKITQKAKEDNYPYLGARKQYTSEKHEVNFRVFVLFAVLLPLWLFSWYYSSIGTPTSQSQGKYWRPSRQHLCWHQERAYDPVMTPPIGNRTTCICCHGNHHTLACLPSPAHSAVCSYVRAQIKGGAPLTSLSFSFFFIIPFILSSNKPLPWNCAGLVRSVRRATIVTQQSIAEIGSLPRDSISGNRFHLTELNPFAQSWYLMKEITTYRLVKIYL